MSVNKFSLAIIIGVILLLAGIYFVPWQAVDWGQLTLAPSQTLTVTGTAQTQLTNEIASFTAGVEAVGDNKEAVANQVNSEADKIVTALKTFGIAEADIQTQNMSIYQEQESYYDDSGSQKTRPGQWRANNSVEITLRDKERVDELSTLLTKSGATNVYGPNFGLEDAAQAGDEPLLAALANAREKADKLAKDQGLEIVKVLSVVEGDAATASPLYALRSDMGGGGGAMVGSTTVSGSVTVTYEVR